MSNSTFWDLDWEGESEGRTFLQADDVLALVTLGLFLAADLGGKRERGEKGLSQLDRCSWGRGWMTGPKRLLLY